MLNIGVCGSINIGAVLHKGSVLRDRKCVRVSFRGRANVV